MEGSKDELSLRINEQHKEEPSSESGRCDRVKAFVKALRDRQIRRQNMSVQEDLLNYTLDDRPQRGEISINRKPGALQDIITLARSKDQLLRAFFNKATT